MLNLALRVPPEVGAAWFKAPKELGKYEIVSLAIQKRLREILPLYFFENEDVFIKKNLQDELYALLTYEAILPQSDFKTQTNKLSRHWRWRNNQVLLKVLNDTETKLSLARNLGKVKARLFFDPDPKMKELADKFNTSTSTQILDILNQAATKNHAVNAHLRNLFELEEKIIAATIKAGLMISDFIEKSEKSPKKALEELQNFGSFITNTFNKNSGFKIIASRRDYTRYLSAELFITIAQVFDPSVQSNTRGMFELLVLKEDADFDFKTYLDGELPEAEALIVSTRIFNFS